MPSTNISNVGWQKSPEGRGTWQILSNCIMTIVICVYTVLHLDILTLPCSDRRRILNVVRWVLVGIVLPEYLLAVAMEQRYKAGHLRDKLNQYRVMDDSQSMNSQTSVVKPWYYRYTKRSRPYTRQETSTNATCLWTIEQAFFILMSGLQVSGDECLSIYSESPTDSHSTVAIDPRMAEVLAEHGLLHFLLPLSREEIADRSKAQQIAKILSFLQAATLLVTVLTRVAYHLPVTELEINTLAHVVLALGIYLCWFPKPLDIKLPYVVETAVGKNLAHAALCAGEFINMRGDYLALSDRENQRVILTGPFPPVSEYDRELHDVIVNEIAASKLDFFVITIINHADETVEPTSITNLHTFLQLFERRTIIVLSPAYPKAFELYRQCSTTNDPFVVAIMTSLEFNIKTVQALVDLIDNFGLSEIRDLLLQLPLKTNVRLEEMGSSKKVWPS